MGREGKKEIFFFEKKNQKTFVCLDGCETRQTCPSASHNEQKFFGSFFQKRTLIIVLFS